MDILSLPITWVLVYEVLAWSIRVVMLLVILRRQMPSTTAMAWLTVIFFQPMVGLFFYLLFGAIRLARHRIDVRREVIRSLDTLHVTNHFGHVVEPHIDPDLRTVLMQAERISGMPIVGGNSAGFYDDNEQFIDALIADIDAAEHHVHMLYYIFASDGTGDRVAKALVRAQERGVTCRVLADHAGSFALFRSGCLVDFLEQRGIEIHPVLPVNLLRLGLARIDLRNHRKLTVIDGRIAYTGSQNIVDSDFGTRRGGVWKDFSTRLQGPVVHQLQLTFAQDWACETEERLEDPAYFPAKYPTDDCAAQAIPTGPTDDDQQAIAMPRLLLAAINHAESRIVMVTPYFVPDESMLIALEMAAERGVDVDICLPRKSDVLLVDWAARANFDRLLSAGVSIHLYDGGTLHAKMLTVDDGFALLGSSNIDVRSFYLNLELNVMLYGQDVTGRLRFAQMKYIEESHCLEIDDWRARPVYQRYLSNAAALLSPLL